MAESLIKKQFIIRRIHFLKKKNKRCPLILPKIIVSSLNLANIVFTLTFANRSLLDTHKQNSGDLVQFTLKTELNALLSLYLLYYFSPTCFTASADVCNTLSLASLWVDEKNPRKGKSFSNTLLLMSAVTSIHRFNPSARGLCLLCRLLNL